MASRLFDRLMRRRSAVFKGAARFNGPLNKRSVIVNQVQIHIASKGGNMKFMY
jgi:hypothetical protein